MNTLAVTNRTHAPCNAQSLYHDIRCGHRVQTQYSSCGTNCTKPAEHTPFICTVCVTTNVRVLMELEGLSLHSFLFSVDADREAKINEIAQKQIEDLIMRNHRPTAVVSKLDPVVQFFSEIGGFQQEPEKDEPNRRYKRPGKAARLVPPTAGFRVDKAREQGRGRARPLTQQTPQLGGKTMVVGSRQHIIPYNVFRDPEMSVRSGPSGLVVGDTPIDKLEPSVPTKADGQNNKPRTRVKSPSQFGDLSIRHRAPNVQNNHKVNIRKDLCGDDADRAVRRALESLSLQ
jgi:hypothetical protein